MKIYDLDCILFDLDGVLVDACDWHYEALNLALSDFGFKPISIYDHIHLYNGLPTKLKLNMLNVPEDVCDFVNKKKQEYTLNIINKNAKTMSEKIELMTYLKENKIKIGCVTNSIRHTAITMLEKTGQFEYIDILVSNEMVNRNKPYPDCYDYAIDQLQVNNLKTLCVEDSPKGIESAKRSKAQYVWTVKSAKEVFKETLVYFLEKI